MPRNRSILLVALVLLLAMLASCLPILAQPARTPHENPAYAQDSPDLVSALVFYGNVFGRAAARQYQDANAMLEELKYANIPDNLRYVLDRYTALCQRLFTTLNNLESLLGEASTLAAQMQTDQARQKLNEAETVITVAQSQLTDVETATAALGDALGTALAPARGRLAQAHQQLVAALARLRELVDKLSQLRQDIAENRKPSIAPRFYYLTSLQVSAPKTAHPGLPITIEGDISSTGSAIDRTIRVLLDGTHLGEATTRGQFQIQITTPPDITAGTHTLAVVAAPQERYTGASKSSPISITRIPLVTEIQVPSVGIVPNPLQFTGQVRHDLGPLPGARVTVTFKGSDTTVMTAADGSFTTLVRVPFDLSLLGPEEITMTVAPNEPWYAPTTTRGRILIINPASVGVMLMAFASLGLLVFKRSRTRPAPPREAALAPVVTRPEPPAAASAPRVGQGLSGTRHRILSAYNASLRVVANVTGTAPTPDKTLTEFLRAVTPLLPVPITPFSELTATAEMALYSSHEVDDQTIARAELLADTITRELHSDAA